MAQLSQKHREARLTSLDTVRALKQLHNVRLSSSANMWPRNDRSQGPGQDSGSDRSSEDQAQPPNTSTYTMQPGWAGGPQTYFGPSPSRDRNEPPPPFPWPLPTQQPGARRVPAPATPYAQPTPPQSPAPGSTQAYTRPNPTTGQQMSQYQQSQQPYTPDANATGPPGPPRVQLDGIFIASGKTTRPWQGEQIPIRGYQPLQARSARPLRALQPRPDPNPSSPAETAPGRPPATTGVVGNFGVLSTTSGEYTTVGTTETIDSGIYPEGTYSSHQAGDLPGMRRRRRGDQDDD